MITIKLCNLWRQNMDDVRSSQWQGGQHTGPRGAVWAHTGQVIHYTELCHCESPRGVQWRHQRSSGGRGQHREAWSASGRPREPCAGAHYHGRWRYSGTLHVLLSVPNLTSYSSWLHSNDYVHFRFALSFCLYYFLLLSSISNMPTWRFLYRTSSIFLLLLTLIDPKVRHLFLSYFLPFFMLISLHSFPTSHPIYYSWLSPLFFHS